MGSWLLLLLLLLLSSQACIKESCGIGILYKPLKLIYLNRCFLFLWLVNEVKLASCKIIQGRNAVDSLSMELGFWIPIISGIPDSLSCIPDSKAHDSGFHKLNLSTFFGNPIVLCVGGVKHSLKQKLFDIKLSGFWWIGTWIPIISGIPDSLSCIPDSKAHDSGFHKLKLSTFFGIRLYFTLGE